MAKTDYVVRAIPSSFVFSDMKLLTDKGAGEAKLFVGPKSRESEIDSFFSFDEGYTYRFDKTNMLEYLHQVKMEFVFQNMNQYKDANLDKWNDIYNTVLALPEADFIIHLSKFADASRYYVRADEELFKKLFRKMVVPKLTDLVLIKDDETKEIVLFIKVNYSFVKNEIDIDEEDPEERNKRLFQYWMALQVKPEGDSDAGNPYSESTIGQYVADISKVELPMIPGRSVFYTTNIGDVEITIESLNSVENKYTPQISAVRKYAEYLATIVSDEDCEEVFTHSLFGIHIKEKNNALSDDNPHVCIGWSDMGDLSGISDKGALATLYDEHFEKNSRGRGQDIGQVWRFLNDVKEGDYIIYAENSVFHIGRIESEYYYDETEYPDQNSDYKNTRKVRWLKKNISRSVLSSDLHNSLKTAMSIWSLNDYKSAVSDLLRGTYQKDDDRIEEEDENMELVFNTDIKTEYERNRIVFGAPGTGKSYGLKDDCEKLMEDTSGTYERVTFHPDYTYSQFVGTYKPVMDADGNSIRYDFVPGPFMRVYVEALKSGRTDTPQPHLLLIEEINRAKVAAVFGDVFQLLDRDDDGVSEYEIQASEDIRRYLAKELGGNADNYKKIRIPNNMFIWATMNSADQGVFPMDTAFKRRWNFEYLGINENEEKIKGIGKIMLPGCNEPIEWNTLRKAINDKMSSSDFKINEDKLMGPFFLSKKVIASNENGMIIDIDRFIDAFKSKVIMYLYEDAVKQGKHRFFEGCDSSKYSSVCEAFDKIGTAIFGATFRENFYDKQRNDA